MAARTRDIALREGRIADVLVGGAAAGPALVLHHGTPSDATVWLDWDGLSRENGLQLISVSRPGYATSTRQAGRRVADAAADINAIVELLGAPWFVTAGWSGGGPHALAGAALSSRCRAAATLAGVGPHGRDDLDFLAGMGPENVEEFGASLAGEAALRAWMETHVTSMRTVSGAELASAFGGLVPTVDRDVLVGGFADRMAEQTRRALAPGFGGWIDDDLAFCKSWGFDVATLAAPVTVWQGDLDLMVPFAHGRWLAEHIPDAQAKMIPGHGHISLIAAYQHEVVRDLLARAQTFDPVI